MNVGERMLAHEHAAREVYEDNDWFAVALRGSQNYNLADESSDVDTNAIVFPSIEDICICGGMAKASTINLVGGEHCDVHDIRDYFRLLKKQGMGFVESLYSDYWTSNPTYTDLWLELREMREQIAHIDAVATISAARGMCISNMKTIEKCGDSSPKSDKALCSIIRLTRFCSLYMDGAGYEECIRIQDVNTRNYMMGVKRGESGIGNKLSFGRGFINSLKGVDKFLSGPHVSDTRAKMALEDILYRAMARMIRNGGIVNE